MSSCSDTLYFATPDRLSDDLCSSAHVCWVVSIIRHSRFYAQPRARTHELDLAEMGSDIVEAECCDTSQHRWQSLNADWAFIVDL